MTDALLKFNLSLAAAAGKDANGDPYKKSYEYHIGMKESPLPFNLWKIKFDSLVRLQQIPETSPLYLAETTMRREKDLCNELGF